MVNAKFVYFILLVVIIMITNGNGRYAKYDNDFEILRRRLNHLLAARQEPTDENSETDHSNDCPYPFQYIIEGNGFGSCSCNTGNRACKEDVECPENYSQRRVFWDHRKGGKKMTGIVCYPSPKPLGDDT
ncbi:hypothetical protein I4U23_023150 [Adineta vaga]|nr:hypothetical protein I4U23_023150 [Adineta vaga]